MEILKKTVLDKLLEIDCYSIAVKLAEMLPEIT